MLYNIIGDREIKATIKSNDKVTTECLLKTSKICNRFLWYRRRYKNTIKIRSLYRLFIIADTLQLTSPPSGNIMGLFRSIFTASIQLRCVTVCPSAALVPVQRAFFMLMLVWHQQWDQSRAGVLRAVSAPTEAHSPKPLSLCPTHTRAHTHTPTHRRRSDTHHAYLPGDNLPIHAGFYPCIWLIPTQATLGKDILTCWDLICLFFFCRFVQRWTLSATAKVSETFLARGKVQCAAVTERSLCAKTIWNWRLVS